MPSEALTVRLVTCKGCGKAVPFQVLYVTLAGEYWHELCWQRECNIAYERETLDDA